jgi:hypothetical protein
LVVTQERVTYFLDLLKRLRVGSRPEEFALVANGYRAEVERMQREVLDFLLAPVSGFSNLLIARWCGSDYL